MILLVLVAVSACKSRRAEPAAPPPAPTAVRQTPPRVEKRTQPRGDAWSPRRASTSGLWRAAAVDKIAAAWDAAADASQDDLDACTEDCVDAAYEVVLARKNAMRAEPIDPPPGDEPAPVPPRVQALVAALDAYVAIADPGDPDVAGLTFLAGSALYRYRQPDAIARFEAVLRDHRDDPTAEYAANTLLDLLLRSGREADARRWVDELLADETFLTGKDALRATLEGLQAMFGAH